MSLPAHVIVPFPQKSLWTHLQNEYLQEENYGEALGKNTSESHEKSLFERAAATGTPDQVHGSKCRHTGEAIIHDTSKVPQQLGAH